MYIDAQITCFDDMVRPSALLAGKGREGSESRPAENRSLDTASHTGRAATSCPLHTSSPCITPSPERGRQGGVQILGLVGATSKLKGSAHRLFTAYINSATMSAMRPCPVPHLPECNAGFRTKR